MYKIYEILKLLVSFCRFDYMFRYESYYLFSYIIDISVDFEPHF